MLSRTVTFIGIVAVLSGCVESPATPPPAPSAKAVATPVVTASERPAASAAPTVPSTSWTEVFGLDRSRFASLIGGPRGLVATACRLGDGGDCDEQIVLLSPDAQSWDLVVLDAPLDLFVPTLHRAGDRLFALGYGEWGQDGGAVVLASTDGRSWSRVESASFRARWVSDVVDTSAGLIAVGYEAPIGTDDTSGFVVWEVEANGAFGIGRAISVKDDALYDAAIWTGDELLAWGFRRWQGGPAALLASPDGETWRNRSPIKDFDDGVVMSMAMIDGKLVAVGYEGRQFPLAPRAWTSMDAGRSWNTAIVPKDDAAMWTVETEGPHLVAWGTEPSGEDRRFAAWTSANGMRWSRAADDEEAPSIDGFHPAQKATIDGRQCVVGTFDGEDSPRGAIYCRPIDSR